MAKKRKQEMKTKATLPTASAEVTDQDKRISFDYEKSKLFRVIHVDGAIGSPTPRGEGIQIGLFSERIPIPKSEEYLITSEDRVGKRVNMNVRPGIFREVEVEAILSLETAKRLRDWLNDKIDFAEKIRSGGALNAKEK